MIKLNIISNKKENEKIVNLFIEKVKKIFKDKKDYVLDIFLDTKEDLDCYILKNSTS